MAGKNWKREPAVRVRLSTYNEAILSKRNVSIVKGGVVTHITDLEMERLAEEWLLFRAVVRGEPERLSGDD